MSFDSVFVTVGTTKFDKLIHTVVKQEILQVLKDKHCKKLKLQIGNGDFIPDCNAIAGISVEYYRFKDSIKEDIIEANLIISHAGAGTCLEVLELKKNLIAVVNDDLMNNHQMELSGKLSEDGYLFYCTCENLLDIIKSSDFTSLKLFKNENGRKCAHLIEHILQICD